MAICPICKVDSVKQRFTWRGIMYSIFCFPCGIYCCMKDRVWYCALCNNEINYGDGTEPQIGRDYRCYKSFRKVGDSGSTMEQGQGTSRSPQTATDGFDTATASADENERTNSGGSESVSSTSPVLHQ